MCNCHLHKIIQNETWKHAIHFHMDQFSRHIKRQMLELSDDVGQTWSFKQVLGAKQTGITLLSPEKTDRIGDAKKSGVLSNDRIQQWKLRLLWEEPVRKGSLQTKSKHCYLNLYLSNLSFFVDLSSFSAHQNKPNWQFSFGGLHSLKYIFCISKGFSQDYTLEQDCPENNIQSDCGNLA